jgi:hypothetical protein
VPEILHSWRDPGRPDSKPSLEFFMTVCRFPVELQLSYLMAEYFLYYQYWYEVRQFGRARIGSSNSPCCCKSNHGCIYFGLDHPILNMLSSSKLGPATTGIVVLRVEQSARL